MFSCALKGVGVYAKMFYYIEQNVKDKTAILFLIQQQR